MSCIVPRTCTEVRLGDSETRGAAQPGDRGADTPSRPLADFRTAPAYVLLGDPGSGKSTSFADECEALGQNACFVTARDFLAFDPSVRPQWREKIIFIDGLDEVRVGSTDVRRPLDAIRRRLDRLGWPRFRLSCREADWLGTNDRTSLVRMSPHALTVLRLDPLADEAVERILSARGDIGDASSFVAAAGEKGVGGFLENPQCLSMLADVVTNGGGWPASRLALFEQACLQMAREHNEEHGAAGPARGGTATPEDDLLDAAGRLCAVLLLSGGAGWAIAPGRDDADHPHLRRCGREYEELCGQAITTKLFKAEAEGRFWPVHRHVAEFLAGRHLARLVDGESRKGKDVRRGIPARRVIALMTGHDGRVVTALRGLSAWMAAQSEKARQDIVERDPIGVGIYGDVSRFSTGQKVALLKSLAGESRQLEEVLRASVLDSSRPMSAAGSLVAPDTEHALREILTNPRRDAEQQTFVVFILRALQHGVRLPGLTDVLLNLVRDESRIPGVQRRALDALVHAGCRDGEVTACLSGLLADVHGGEISDPDDHLLGALLMRLYPGSLSPAEVWTYLSESAAPFFGQYFTFWQSHLVAEAPDAELAEHLDLLVAQRDALQAALRSRGLEELPAQLLARGLDACGERLEAKRLHDWLGVGLTWDCSGGASARIRDWLTRRPAIQKAILVEGMQRCAKSQDGDLRRCALDVERRLYGAGCPPDFGLWCLERAEEATDSRVAGYFLDKVHRTLESRVGDDGLTRDHVIERTHEHPILARLLEEKSALALDVEWLEIHHHLAQAERERERKHGEWLRHVRAHETALRQNRCPPALLHQLAAAYFDRLVDVVGTTPAARLEHLFRGDGRLLEAAWGGLCRAIDRDDLPDVEEIVRLRDNDQLHFLALPVLGGRGRDARRRGGRAGSPGRESGPERPGLPLLHTRGA